LTLRNKQRRISIVSMSVEFFLSVLPVDRTRQGEGKTSGKEINDNNEVATV